MKAAAERRGFGNKGNHSHRLNLPFRARLGGRDISAGDANIVLHYTYKPTDHARARVCLFPHFSMEWNLRWGIEPEI